MRKVAAEKLAQIESMARRGLPQIEIARIVGVSPAFVNGHLKKLRAGTAAIPSPVAPSEQPAEAADPDGAPEAVPEAVPDGADVATVDRWIATIEAAAEAARARQDLAAMSSLTMRLVALLEHKRKVAPPVAPDPNANPDFVEAARVVRERWDKLLAGLAGK